MIFLALFATLFLPSDSGFVTIPKAHLSDALRLKCDALPYRTSHVDYGCYYAVIGEIKFTIADATCSEILYGAKVVAKIPAATFDTLMVDKSKFHFGLDPSGSKSIICFYESDYSCDVDQSMIISGRCPLRAGKKMNYEDADNYCKSRGMELPAPSSDLDNRIVRDALLNGPAWVQKTNVRENGYKWKQVKSFSRWGFCSTGDSQNSCTKDTGTVLDKDGYWNKNETKDLMDVVCIKSAINGFTAAAKAVSCDYQEAGGKQLEIATNEQGIGKTCYIANRTSTRFDVIGRATVETRRMCEVQCNAQSKCVAFSYKDAGFSSSCVLLSTANANDLCDPPTQIYLKKTTGCVARTNIVAEFGTDPCIDQRVDSAFRGTNTKAVCILTWHKEYIIRAIDADGRRITLNNDEISTIRPSGDMWMYIYDWNGCNYTRTIVAATCANAGGVKCPCSPVGHLKDVGYPNVPALPEVVGPCRHAGKTWLYYDENMCTHGAFYLKKDATYSASVKCKSGLWVLYMSGYDNAWSLNNMSCV